MNPKALARFFYANVPGVAAARFAAKDYAASYFSKPEYKGAGKLPLSDGLIVDVGANRGQSIAAFKRLEPRVKIVAFEPEPMAAQRLSMRYRNDQTVTVHGCALGACPGVITFFIPKYGSWDCDGMASTDREQATSWLSDPGRMYHYDKSKLTLREYPAECRTLDSYELSPQLIKLHAQGAELEIVKGTRHTMKEHRPALMCAFPTPAFTEFVREFGYRPYIYSDGHFSPGLTRPPVTFTWYLTNENSIHRSIVGR